MNLCSLIKIRWWVVELRQYVHLVGKAVPGTWKRNTALLICFHCHSQRHYFLGNESLPNHLGFYLLGIVLCLAFRFLSAYTSFSA